MKKAYQIGTKSLREVPLACAARRWRGSDDPTAGRDPVQSRSEQAGGYRTSGQHFLDRPRLRDRTDVSLDNRTDSWRAS